MKNLLLILLALLMCLSVFVSCGDKDDTSSLSPESKDEESGQISSESSEASKTDISESVSENESESIDNGSSEDVSDDSGEVSNEEKPENKTDESKNTLQNNASSNKTSKYYAGEYTLDINTYANKYGNICEMYSYTGENDKDSLIDIIKDKSVSDDTVLFLGENYTANPLDDELFKALHKNVKAEEGTPYVKDFNGVFESVIPSDEDWLNRTAKIVGKADLSDYCVCQYSKIPYFMSVGYYTVGALREMANNGSITFYFTRLPEPEKGEKWLDALPECENIGVH